MPARTRSAKRAVSEPLVDQKTKKTKTLQTEADCEQLPTVMVTADKEPTLTALKEVQNLISVRARKQKPQQNTKLGAATTSGATRAMEQNLWDQGYVHVFGVDEAGRGPLAGPVVAAACCIPPQVCEATAISGRVPRCQRQYLLRSYSDSKILIPGINDSKQLNEQQREELYETITTTPGIVWAACIVDHTTIDRVNILQATMQAMSKAASDCINKPGLSASYLLVDGNRLPKDLPAPAEAVVQGDARCVCIAAASIIAKVTRDRLMMAYDLEFPGYNFAQHKGYAVPEHYRALETHGPCAIHRRSFQPVRGMTGWTREQQLAEEAAAGTLESKLAQLQQSSPDIVNTKLKKARKAKKAKKT